MLPVVRALAKEGAIVSIDTRHVAVAKAAVRCGASIVNDVTGFTDPAMVQVAAETDCGLVVMHWDQGGLGTHAPRRQVVLDESRPALPEPNCL